MATVVRRAVKSDMFHLFELVRTSNLNKLPLAARQRGFDHVWGGEEPYYGYVLEDEDGKIVGFLGTLRTRRALIERQAIRRMCTIDDVVGPVEFLLSPAAGFVARSDRFKKTRLMR
jgi:hypothetical protein